ncbi:MULTISPECIES: universal stress protein [Haloferax]|uniref:Universal stress protein n=1 Tax=Haloferax marinum TaxID=2666143 RepID=A0A6A8GAZ7_9EURY|nr:MULTISPECIES: universal stress protein [Haloferax]KAB1198686.1 universal stress protein [Haloferax sp. CBA1150]MRW97802.1 universal stress protein [Haloferax marinum]
MHNPRSDKPVLVGVESLDNVQQLVRTAGDLADLGAGTVRVVTVAVKRSDSPFRVFSDETIVREFADSSHELLDRATTPEGVTIERDVLVARSAARGLLAAVEETDPAALVVGWRPQEQRTDAVFGTTVDALVERAPCDLYVERVGHEANGVDSILLPVAGGPHVETAARAAIAIAARNDARVLVFSVETSGDAAALAAEGREALAGVDGPEVPVETTVRESDDVTGAIVDEAAAHDVVVMGATRKGSLRRKLVGSVPRRVVDQTDRTVILARSGDVVGGPLHELGRLLRRW